MRLLVSGNFGRIRSLRTHDEAIERMTVASRAELGRVRLLEDSDGAAENDTEDRVDATARDGGNEGHDVLLPLVAVELEHAVAEVGQAEVALALARRFEVELLALDRLRRETASCPGALEVLELRLLVARDFGDLFAGQLAGESSLLVSRVDRARVDGSGLGFLLLAKALGVDELGVGAVGLLEEDVVRAFILGRHGRL